MSGSVIVPALHCMAGLSLPSRSASCAPEHDDGCRELEKEVNAAVKEMFPPDDTGAIVLKGFPQEGYGDPLPFFAALVYSPPLLLVLPLCTSCRTH